MDYKGRNPSPQNDSRACLCKDNETYSKDCCNGSLQAQGIGSITKTSITRYYTATNCSGGKKHIHTHDLELTVGEVYYLTFVHHNHTDCYTITATRNNGDFEVNAFNLYDTCVSCQAGN